jgi:hypothetical protein
MVNPGSIARQIGADRELGRLTRGIGLGEFGDVVSCSVSSRDMRLAGYVVSGGMNISKRADMISALLVPLF